MRTTHAQLCYTHIYGTNTVHHMPYDLQPPWEAALKITPPSFLVPTEIRPSLIPNAGLGRFALDYIPSGTAIRITPITDFDDTTISQDNCLCITTLDELMSLTHYLTALSTQPMHHTLNRLTDYLFAVSGEKYNNSLFLYAISGYYNHDFEPNSQQIIRNDHMHWLSSREILPGEELLDNYAQHTCPLFYGEFCKKFNLETSLFLS